MRDTSSAYQFQPSFRETKDTVRVSLQEYRFTGSSRVTSCGFWQKRVRLLDLLEGRGLTALQEPTSTTVLLVLPKALATNPSLSTMNLEAPIQLDMGLGGLHQRHTLVSLRSEKTA